MKRNPRRSRGNDETRGSKSEPHTAMDDEISPEDLAAAESLLASVAASDGGKHHHPHVMTTQRMAAAGKNALSFWNALINAGLKREDIILTVAILIHNIQLNDKVSDDVLEFTLRRMRQTFAEAFEAEFDQRK